MDSIEALQKIVDKTFKEYRVERKPGNLYTPIHYAIEMGGKRIRPLLVLLAGQMLGGETMALIPAAKAIEIFHNFTLIHDDIMDNAPVRRGKQSVFKKWDTNTAILAGDAMLILALKELEDIKTNRQEIFKLFNETALLVCEGQQLDMDFEKKTVVSIEDYINMIALKTAVLLAAALKMGALAANADKNNADLLYDCGYNLGIAFQLKDDLLDIFSTTNNSGKQKGGDIISAKKTFLYLKTLELLTQKEKKAFIQTYHSSEKNKVEKIKQQFAANNIPQHTENLIAEYFDKGLFALKQINLPESQKAPLLDLIEQLHNRKG